MVNMDILINIIISFISAIFGALASVGISIYLSYRRFSLGPDIQGDWETEYQAADTPGNPWVKEKLKFKIKKGKILFYTYNNQRNDEIEGEAEQVGNEYIIGKWRQSDPKASNRGTFLLNISPSGKIIFGVWSGTSDTGEKRIGGWVAARSPADLQTGKQMLSELTANLEIKD
jgi:hypothetical protein